MNPIKVKHVSTLELNMVIFHDNYITSTSCSFLTLKNMTNATCLQLDQCRNNLCTMFRVIRFYFKSSYFYAPS